MSRITPPHDIVVAKLWMILMPERLCVAIRKEIDFLNLLLKKGLIDQIQGISKWGQTLNCDFK